MGVRSQEEEGGECQESGRGSGRVPTVRVIKGVNIKSKRKPSVVVDEGKVRV